MATSNLPDGFIIEMTHEKTCRNYKHKKLNENA